MKNQLKINQLKLTASHNGRDLTFMHPNYGPNTYANVKADIEKDNLRPAIMAETASLVHTAFNSIDKYSVEIKDLMRDRYLWIFTGILYVPNKGAYLQDAPKTRNGMLFMDESDLIKRLESGDSSVRHVPFGYKTESMSPLELGKNPYVIALAGEEGAEKLAQMADKHKRKPYLWSFESVSEPLTRVSALCSDWGLDDWLDVSGYYLGGNGDGCAFGVQDKTGEASPTEE